MVLCSKPGCKDHFPDWAQALAAQQAELLVVLQANADLAKGAKEQGQSLHAHQGSLARMQRCCQAAHRQLLQLQAAIEAGVCTCGPCCSQCGAALLVKYQGLHCSFCPHCAATWRATPCFLQGPL